ncbi:MAG: hypothetical protein GX552_07470 [Chloroflexi bacterium]|jgi:uroporphyrinogen decarboxylase|nr:hypothetical protein [Chloroflexota bacterium]
MTTSRQRMLDAFHFTQPDKMPVVYHPSPAGLLKHGQKLLDLFNAYPPDNPITFERVPQPPPGTVDAEGNYHEIRTDEWGTVWEHYIYGIWGIPKQYPFASWQAARDYAMPPVPTIGSPAFHEEKVRIAALKEQYMVFHGGISLLEKLQSLRPMEDVLLGALTDDQDFLAFLERLAARCQQEIAYSLALEADAISFGDDWGTQKSQLVSTTLFRRIFKPLYRELFAQIKQAGKKVFFHSCGRLEALFDELLDLGIDGYWPQITCYGEDFPQVCKQHGVAIYIHPDRQRLIPLGTPQEIDDAIHRYADIYHALGGGGIFYVEIENDAPFENVQALVEAVHRYR